MDSVYDVDINELSIDFFGTLLVPINTHPVVVGCHGSRIDCNHICSVELLFVNQVKNFFLLFFESHKHVDL